MTVKRPMWSSESFSARFPVGRILYVIDVLAWMFAILLAALLRYEFAANSISWDILVGAIAGAAILQLCFGLVFHLYRKGMRFRTGGFEDTVAVGLAVGAVGGI
ncbi:polysaccharide biosynthesis protein, partial [Corynebacterium casei]